MNGELIEKLKQLNIIHKGGVTLKNAGTSDFYVDIKKAFGYPNILNLICDELWREIERGVTCIAAGGYGGLPLATAISLKHHLYLTIIRDEPKKHGKGGSLDGYTPDRQDRIAIVDDVLTTGESLRKIIKTLKPTGATIVGCYVVIKRGSPHPRYLKYLLTHKELLTGEKKCAESTEKRYVSQKPTSIYPIYKTPHLQ